MLEGKEREDVKQREAGGKEVRVLARRIVGPFPRHCAGAGLLSTQAYVTTPLIGLGVAPLTCSPGGSLLLDQIIAFDRAEAETANLTQTNLITVSSFNGLQGLLWGYDLVPQPLRRHPCLSAEAFPHVYDAQPLLDATLALYGTVREPRFPIAPGQHVLCACKTLYWEGPCRLYGALAVAIAADRSKNADLFMEDHGTLEDYGRWEDHGTLGEGFHEQNQHEQEGAVLERLIDAVGQISDNLDVRYEKVFVGFRARAVPAGEIGCVLTAAPYIHLAQDAILHDDPERLTHLSLADWQQAVHAGS